MRSYKQQKSALTRVINKGDADKIIAECDRFEAEYEEANQPVPDDWHRWNIAKQDAEFAKARERGSW